MKRLFVLIAAVTMALSAAPAFAKTTFDPYTDDAKASRFDSFTDGARSGKFDTFGEGAKAGKFDVFTDGAAI
ncbi:hypothetical protein [Cupriavidus campinensis]